MPAVPVYTASPVNAAKALGPTPKTAPPAPDQQHQAPGAPTMTTSASPKQGYPAPQPAARPSLPVQTGTPQPHSSLPVEPTPTHRSIQDGPPAPQPGAVPIPPSSGGASHLPPPPKSGEAQRHPQTAAVHMPPQMSYPQPGSTQTPAGKPTSTAPPPPSLVRPAGPVTFLEAGPAGSYSHPPGYHQDVYASDFNSSQRATHNALSSQNQHVPDNDDDESVWGTAKNWASAVGNSLAAAENEVWKRINKD